MDKAIFQLEKGKTFAKLEQLDLHNTRMLKCNNVDKSKTMFNKYLIEPASDTLTNTWVYKRDMAEIEHNHTIKIRTNSVLFADIMLSFSHEAIDRIDVNKWCDKNKQWICDYFGEQNVLSMILHLDESTPHIHTQIIPINKDGRLSFKSFINGPTSLRKLQDSYKKAMEEFGLTITPNHRRKPNYKSIKSFYRAIYDIENNPKIKQEDYENQEDYIKALETENKTLEYGLYYEQLKRKKIEDEMGNIMANVIADYYPAIHFTNLLLKKYQDEKIVRKRIEQYQSIEFGIYLENLDKALEMLVNKGNDNNILVKDFTKIDDNFEI